MSISVSTIYTSLERLKVPLSYAEAHGLSCGLLCASQTSVAKTRWFTELLDAADLQAAQVAAQADDLRILDSWFAETQTSLNDANLEFLPAVPPDEEPLATRVQALADFCSGFTYGVGISAAQRTNQALPPDTRELIEDFQAIDGVSADGTSAADEDAYVELLEYVKVGVLLILEELKPVIPTQQEMPS